jgi:uracil-DNA glycosylase
VVERNPEYQEQRSPLLQEIRRCRTCVGKLPFAPKPVLNFAPAAKILIVGQAPGTKVHATGIPWNDPSGDRLRLWLGVEPQQFYDPQQFAITPIGFCYPGKGKSGDLPPRRECAPQWMPRVLQALPNLTLILLIGSYSQKFFLGAAYQGLTTNVKNWQQFAPRIFPLPHPSPRNNIWLKRNAWFERDLVPRLRQTCQPLLSKNA